MATTEELARDLLASVDTDAGALNAIKWIDSRYQQLVSRVRFKHLRKLGELSIPAAVTGTCTVTSGSTAVVGSGTTWSTVPSSGLSAYWYMKISNIWNHVAAVSSHTALTLTNAWTGSTTTDTAFTMVKRYHELATNARFLGTFIHTRLRTKMDGPIPMDKLDREAPGRTHVVSIPLIVAHAGVDSTGDLLVEVYPYCKSKELIHYTYWDLPTALVATGTIPTQIDPYVLKEGALIDLYRYLKGKALNANRIEAAALYRNDEHAAITRWERRIQEAARADRGVDDTTFILEHFGGRVSGRDIKYARDIVLDRWDYP